MHTWTKKNQRLVDKLHLAFGQVPQKERHNEPLPQTASPWESAVASMRRTFQLLKTNQELLYKTAYHKGYRYDRVTFTRVEHVWRIQPPFVSLYSYDVSDATWVGFGATKFSFIPTLILTD